MDNQKPTETLAAFAQSTRLEDLPRSARDHARDLLLDAVACALAADYGDETQDYLTFSRTVGGAGPSTIVGRAETLSPLGATLFNAYQITAATVCDVYVPAHVHITPEIVPPALAIAEREGASGGDLLAAIAIGSEISVRVANAIDYAFAGPHGWHMPGIVGPFGAAAATARLTGLTPLQMRNAFGLAGSQSAGTWASWGTPSVKFHQSRGAASGLIAGLLAGTDFTSSSEILTHPDGGILSAYSNGGRPEELLDGLGSRYTFEAISLRLWPGGTPLQPALTAVFDLQSKKSVSANDVAKVRIEVAPVVHEAHARFDQPKGTFENLLSFHFAVASALRDASFWFTSLSDDKANDPALRAFMQKAELVANEALTREQCRIVLTLNDGSTLEAGADAAKGTARNPATLDDLKAKYGRCIQGRMDEDAAGELLDILVGIEDVSDLRRFFELLRAPRARA